MDTFFIAGGDDRSDYLYRLLSDMGWEGYGPGSLSLKEAAEKCRLILGPVPFSKDGQHLFYPAEPDRYDIKELLSCLTPGHTLFGGAFPEEVRRHCSLNRIPCHDLMKLEMVALKNAAATAEGAIAEAISLSPGMLHQSRCLILGFGRCGQCLADKLSGLCTHPVIADRQEAALAKAWSLGFEAISIKELKKALPGCDFIFNTIPAPVLDASMIQELPADGTIIDIASAPGGVDFEACKRAGIRAKLCPGLPGRFSPLASAQILRDAVISLEQV